jgi:hypothetical protein
VTTVAVHRMRFLAHAYCLGADGGEDGGPCPFQRQATPSYPEAQVLAEAERHVAETTGHTVLIDVVDRTAVEPAPEPAGVTS